MYKPLPNFNLREGLDLTSFELNKNHLRLLSVLFLLFFAFAGNAQEICNNSIDDDADGLIDCADTTDCRPTMPGTITASPVTTCVGNSATYSITAVAGAASYQWSTPAQGLINSGQGTISINVTWLGKSTASLCVRTVSAAGCKSNYTCISPTITRKPPTPDGIGNY